MPKLQIPERHQPSLAKIAHDVDDDAIRIIRQIFDRAPDTSNPIEISSSDAAINTVASIPLAGILDALSSLYILKAGTESVSLEQFVDDISDAMASASPEFRLPQNKRQEFRKRMLALLGSEHFLTISKGYDLATDDERTFCDARIITDLRPVFGTPIEDGPKGTVIVHLLKIGYHEGAKRHQSFHVALDSRDLKELKRVIERAEHKAAAIKSKLKDAHVLGIS